MTEFHRRVFVELMRQHATDQGLRFELFGAVFTPDEMGRIERMEMLRQQLVNNGTEVFRSAVEVLRDVAKKTAASEGDLNAHLAYLREKKAKLHKGKAEEK